MRISDWSSDVCSSDLVTSKIIYCLLGTLLCAGPALAQDGLGPGSRPKRPSICMNDAELEAEAQMRAGIVLRAFARTCAVRGIDGSILPEWRAFDAANAERLPEAVRLRNDASARNYTEAPHAGQPFVSKTLYSPCFVSPSLHE